VLDTRRRACEASGVRTQLAALVRAHRATSGAAALRRALPVYLGLLVAASQLFGGYGLAPETVVAGAGASPLARALLWTAWLVLSTPTLDAVWRTPASFWLRSLPVPRAWHLAVLLAMSLLAEAPWVALWWAGGGALAGLAALGGALAGHALLLARPPGAPGLALALAGLAALVAAPTSVLSFGTWPIALVGLRAAWLAAPARPAARPRAWIPRPRPAALALAQLVGLARGHLPALLRGALLVALAAAAAWLAARNNGLADLDARLGLACGFLAPAALLAGSAAAGPLLAAERRADWLLVVAGASPRLRLAALVLAGALVGAVLGLAAALALAGAWALPARDVLRLLALVPASAALAVLAALVARHAAALGPRGPGRQVLGLSLAVVAALAVLAVLGPAAPLAWALAAGVAWSIGHVRSDSFVHPSPGDAAVLLEMTAVRKRLGTRVVLESIDLACAPGETALVLGENGAGKSTLLRVAAGVVEPDAGAVAVAGAPLAGGAAPRRALGYAPDTADAFPDLSVRELLALVAALKQAPPADPALRDRLGLAPVWHQRLRTLSFGQVKRTYLLAALVGPPPLLILDEPSNGLDPDGVRTLQALLRERAARGEASLVATNDAAFADGVAGPRHRLAAGRLAPA
jgi:ABC-type Mn2+/Zn2+ transport system ATPase subunit